MDGSRITTLDSPQTPEASPIRKPLSIKTLQILILIWGCLSLINLLIYSIAGKELIISILGTPLYLPLPSNFWVLDDFYLLSITFGIGIIMIEVCLFQFSKYSLNIARRYIVALFFIIVSYLFLTALLLPSRLFPILVMTFSPPWYYGILIFVLTLGDEVILVSTVIFAFIKTKNLLATNLPDRKTILTPIERFGKLSYVPLIVMLILFGLWCISYLYTVNTVFNPNL
jgi:hypothetical protein